MTLMTELRGSLLPGKIIGIHVGLSRTAVLADTPNGLSCGLAATLSNPEFDHCIHPSVKKAGHLLEMDVQELTGLVESESYTEVGIGLAVINALLPRFPELWIEQKGEDYLLQHIVNKKVVVVGHFPSIEKLRQNAMNLWVLELNPREGELHSDTAPEIIPQADVVVLTATTLINKTFEALVNLCNAETKVMVLGPSTPLSPVMFDYGVDFLCGTIVTDPKAVMLGISQGSSSHQIRRAGFTKMVTMKKGD